MEKGKAPSIAVMIAKKAKRTGDDEESGGMDYDRMAEDLIEAIHDKDEKLVSAILRALGE